MRPFSTQLFALTAGLPVVLLPALACMRAGPPPARPAPTVAARAPTTLEESVPAAGRVPGGMGRMMSGMMARHMGSGRGLAGRAGPGGCPMRAAGLASPGAPVNSATLAGLAACPEPTEALATEGKGIFTGKGNCYTCHGMDAKGTALAPSLLQHKWLNVDGSYAAIARLVTTGVPQPKEHPAPMPPMGGAQLTASEVCAVAAYVYRLSHH